MSSQSRKPSVPCYSSLSYWETRFSASTTQDPSSSSTTLSKSTTEPFEWLTDGSEIISFLLPHLSSSSSSSSLLHIGVGSSQLSHLLVSQYHFSRQSITNIDFSNNAIQVQKLLESKMFGDQKMNYAVLDLLNWSQVSSLISGSTNNNDDNDKLFSILLDKSTTDSISTGTDVRFVLDLEIDSQQQELKLQQDDQQHSTQTVYIPYRSNDSICPAIVQLVQNLGSRRSQQSQRYELTLSPVHLLSLHLASVTKPGGLWFCQSYSSDRWRDIVTLQNQHGNCNWPWNLIQKQAIEIPQGQTKSSTPVYTPQLYHYLYILQHDPQSV